MKLSTRYQRLNLWNKVAFWGSAASIFGVALVLFSAAGQVTRQYRAPIKIDRLYDEIDSRVFEGVGMDSPIDQVKTSVNWITTTPFMSFSLSSIANKSMVQIAPYLVIDVIDARALEMPMVALYEGERGGAEILREFQARLLPVQGIQIAPLSSRNVAAVDFFSLTPGEVEEFFLNVSTLPGYRVVFRVGIQYRYEGSDNVVWLDKQFEYGLPKTQIPISLWSKAYEVAYHPDFYPENSEQYYPEYVRYWTATRQFINSKRVFLPSQIGLQLAAIE